jgi:hypothetical protein
MYFNHIGKTYKPPKIPNDFPIELGTDLYNLDTSNRKAVEEVMKKYDLHGEPPHTLTTDKFIYTFKEMKIRSMIKSAIVGDRPTDKDLKVLTRYLIEHIEYRPIQLDTLIYSQIPEDKVGRYIIMEDIDSHLYDDPLGKIYMWIYLVWNMSIRKCKREKCKKFFVPLQEGATRLYCSRNCAKKARSEKACEETGKEAKDVHRKLCDLIDKWLGRRDSMNVTAFELKNMLEKITKREGITDIPLLKGNTAKNLGQYLRYIKKMLEDECEITYETDKEGSEYMYSFTRIQS